MRKIIAFEWLSLDGFMAGPNGETDWFVWDEEIEKYCKEVQNRFDTMLFGRATYETMANYWPTHASSNEDPGITDFMNNTHKIVFSKTLEKVDWNNSSLAKEIVPEEIDKMKQPSPGCDKDMVIYGSGGIVSQLMKLDLIDEYQIMVNPVVLGSGKSMFQNIEERFKLKLLNTKTFASGNVMFYYNLLKIK